MVTLTETAAKKVQDLRLEEGKPEWGLRVRVVGGGCSGMSYELGWEEQVAEGGNAVESPGGKGGVGVEPPGGGPGEAAWAAVAERSPALLPYRPHTLFAVGQDYVAPEHPLRAGDEVCLFPPVSGGSDGAGLSPRAG